MGLADLMGTKKSLFSKMRGHAKKLQSADLQARYGKKPDEPPPDAEPVPGADDVEGSPAEEAAETPAMEATEMAPDGDEPPLDAGGPGPDDPSGLEAPAPGGDNPAVKALAGIDAEQLKSALLELLSKSTG